MMEKKQEPKLHSGKWTPEEEAYVEALMTEFRDGYLDVQEGTTLRSFLATKLNCKPKRISKKYEGKNYDGKQLYWNSEEDLSPQERRARRANLQRLELKFKECVKAIEIVKASRVGTQKNASPKLTSADCGQAAFPAAAAMRPRGLESPLLSSISFPETYLARTSPPTAASVVAPSMATAAASLPDLYATHPSEALLLARRHRQQALELELAATGAHHHHHQNPLLATSVMHRSHLGSLLSTPSSLHHSAARQEALLGLSSLNRPTSPSALGLHFARPPSPRTAPASLLHHQAAAQHHHHQAAAQAAALEQARLMRGMYHHQSPSLAAFRPSLNTMLNSSHVRAPTGNQLAVGAFEDSLMRLQQPELELFRQRRQFEQQQQQVVCDERKRQALHDEQQRKRQRLG